MARIIYFIGAVGEQKVVCTGGLVLFTTFVLLEIEKSVFKGCVGLVVFTILVLFESEIGLLFFTTLIGVV